jgi:hypothetical protein
MSNGDSKLLKVFVSYSRTDFGFVEQLVRGLQDKGFSPMLDRDQIGAAEDWRARISALIVSTDALVAVVTEAWLQSPVCQDEAKLAFEDGKRLFPVLPALLCENASVPASVAALNYVHFYYDARVPGSGFYDGLCRLCDGLSRDIVWHRNKTWLLEAAERWIENGARPTSGLLARGTGLSIVEGWLDQAPSGEVLPNSLRAYIDASLSADLLPKHSGPEDARVFREEKAWTVSRFRNAFGLE